MHRQQTANKPLPSLLLGLGIILLVAVIYLAVAPAMDMDYFWVRSETFYLPPSPTTAPPATTISG